MNAVVICTSAGRWNFLREILKSLYGYHKYPIYIVINDAPKAEDFPSTISNYYSIVGLDRNYWELGAIQAMLNYPVEEFFFLQDSLDILDVSFINYAFERWPGQSVAFDRHFSMYMGKYRREPLLNMGDLPLINSKGDAIYSEFKFIQKYVKFEPQEIPVLDYAFADNNPNNYWEDKYGRKNLVLVSPYLRKYKGTVGEWIGEI